MAVSLQQIFWEHFEAFAARHPLADYQRQAARRICDCRTAALGGHWVACPNGCVCEKRFNSCHHRSCPQCANLERERWLATQKERLLDCPHYHVVFTVDHGLIPLWRYNKRQFANVLFHAASDALRELLGDEKYLGALPGLLAALHTWGQTLVMHPHLHVIVTAGGLTPQGQWRAPKKGCLLPRRVLMTVFRGKMRAYLLKALEAGDLTLPPDRSQAQVRSLLNRVGRTAWNVKILDRYEHGRGVLTYLARYLKGGPIGHGRILDCRAGRVRFTYRDHADADESEGRGPRKTLSLDVDTFLARVLEHVPPPSLQTVRGYGLYASSKQAELSQARVLFGQRAQVPRRQLGWREVLQRCGQAVATVCPECGAPLESLGRIPPSRSFQQQPPQPHETCGAASSRGPPQPLAESPAADAA